MIIVNQNKNEFVNFDNIMNVCVTDCDEDGFGIFAGFIVGRDDNYRGLGYYKTEERAKEVLKEIIRMYQETRIIYRGQANYNPVNSIDRPIYEMPKE